MTEAGNEGAVGKQESPSAYYYSIDQSHTGIAAASPSQKPQYSIEVLVMGLIYREDNGRLDHALGKN